MALADTAKLIASLELQDKFSGPARRVEGSIGRLEGSTGRLGNIGNQASRGIGNATGALIKLGVVATGVLAGGLAISIKAASDLNEEIDKAKVVFGPAADEMIRFADGAASIGLSKTEALGAAGAFGNMFNTIGFAQSESQEMSETMVQLAADMASFNNEDPSEMLDKLRSGLAGEAEPLRRFGVLLSEAEVKAFAYSHGIADAGEKLTEAQKVQARYGYILEATAIQQGNFALTSKSLANQQRQLRSNLSNTAATIGTAFLPAVSRLLQGINELFLDKQPQIAQFGERLATSLERVFSNDNIDRGMERVGGFIDQLAAGGDLDLSGITGKFSGVIAGVSNLPWESIGNAARLLGTGSKAMLDAFLGLPGWVQTAVLTGWGLNKLTGGAFGSIIGSLGKGLFGSLRGSTPATPVFVQQVGGLPGGGTGVPGGPGGLGGLVLGPGFATALGMALAPILAFNVLPSLFPGKPAAPGSLGDPNTTRIPIKNGGVAVVPAGTGQQWLGLMPWFPNPQTSATPTGQFVPANMGGTPLQKSVDKVTKAVGELPDTALMESGFSGIEDKVAPLPSILGDLKTQGATSLGKLDANSSHLSQLSSKTSSSLSKLDTISSRSSAVAAAVNGQTGILRQIAGKNFSPTVKVDNKITIPVSVSATLIQQKIYEQSVTTNGLPGTYTKL